LQGIVDMDAPGCGSGGPCIDQTAFGPTAAGRYWTLTSPEGLFDQFAWFVDFGNGDFNVDPKNQYHSVRAVRSAL
jgi:hypothetical protein